MELTEFLRARLDEDEAGWKQVAAREDGVRESISLFFGAVLAAKMLRDVAAKRAIVDEHSPTYPVTYPEPSGQPTCGVCHAGGWDWEPHGWPCPTVRALAAVYSDHPDYRAEWKP